MSSPSAALVTPFPGGMPLLGIEREVYELASGLVSRHWDVEVITTEALWKGHLPAYASTSTVPGTGITRLRGHLASHLQGIQASGAPCIVPALRNTVLEHDVAIYFNAGWPVTLSLAGLPHRGQPSLYRTYWHPAFGRHHLLNRAREYSALIPLRRCQTLLVPTIAEIDLLSRRMPPQVKLILVEAGTTVPPMPSPAARIDLRRQYSISEEALVLIQIGQISSFKGTQAAIAAARLLSDSGEDVTLLLVGRECEEPSLSRLVKSAVQRGLVRALGPIDDEEKSSLLHLSDVLVMVSHYEAYGFVAIEALAHGVVPVIYEDFPAAATLLQRGAVGVPRLGGVKALADAIRRAKRSEIGESQRSWDEYVVEVDHELRSLLG